MYQHLRKESKKLNLRVQGRVYLHSDRNRRQRSRCTSDKCSNMRDTCPSTPCVAPVRIFHAVSEALATEPIETINPGERNIRKSQRTPEGALPRVMDNGPPSEVESTVNQTDFQPLVSRLDILSRN